VGVTMTTKELKNQQVTYYFITGWNILTHHISTITIHQDKCS